jgi:PAS domain S-box-containing protein
MTAPVRALLVEASSDDAEVLLRELRRAGFEPVSERVDTAAAMRAALEARPWDIILAGHTLPQFDAAAALALRDQLAPDASLIVVSDTFGEEAVVAAMRAGASDYVPRWNLTRLGPAVRRELREAESRRERWRAEQAAYRLAAIVQSSGDAIIGKALDGTITDWNPGAERLFGFTAAEAVGQHISLLVPPDRGEALKANMDRLRQGERVAPFEAVQLRKDRSAVHVLLTISPILDAAGRVIGSSAISHDLSRRKRAEEALLLRDRAIQALAAGIVITDASRPDNPIIYASPGFERLTGYTAGEVLGKDCLFLQSKGTASEAVATVRAALRDGRACDADLISYRKDGTPFWGQLLISPVRNEAGRLTHFVGVLSDVTVRHRLEEQFRQAQKMEAVGRLAGGVAHDFNNLLTVINGYGEIVLGSLPEGHPARELVRQIKEAGERAASLTRQLLAFSRKSVLEPKVLDLNAGVREMEKLLRCVIGEDIQLATVLEPDLGRVRADPGQLEQAVINLCVNARDAMPHGGKLTLETRDVELDAAYAQANPDVRPGPYVLLAVSDTGHGMDAATIARIFEPFFTTKGQGKGTGLGLAMVYGFVKQSGGHIAVYSEPGQGATFKIYLPQVEAAVTARKSHHGPMTLPRGTETVLLVEDEEGVRALIRHVLKSSGYTVLQAGHGQEALRVAERHAAPIHLLLTDVVMPGGMGGRQVAEAVRARHPEARVLFVSGYTEDAVVRHGVLEENTNFLQKPFMPAALVLKVREILDQAQPEGGAEQAGGGE